MEGVKGWRHREALEEHPNPSLLWGFLIPEGSWSTQPSSSHSFGLSSELFPAPTWL